MKRGFSLRIQIAVFSALVAAVVLASFAAFSLSLVARQKMEKIDDQIVAFGLRLPGRPVGRGGSHRFADFLEQTFGPTPAFLHVISAGGTEIYRSQDWPNSLPLRLPPSRPPLAPSDSVGRMGGARPAPVLTGLSTERIDTGHFRVGILATPEADYILAISLQGLRTEMLRLRNGYFSMLLPALAVVGLGGWLVSNRAMRPLHKLALTAERIGSGDFTQRMAPVQTSPEINRLATVLNRMLDCLEVSRQQAARFSADASHELKTPLSAMQATIEDALRHAPPDSEIENLGLGLSEEIARLKSIMDSLLLLARADSGALAAGNDRCEIVSTALACAGDWEPIAAEAEIELRLHPGNPGSLWVRAQPDLVRRALDNLLDNAIKYNHPGGRVDLYWSAEEQTAVVEVANTGHPLAPIDRERIFDRFYRGAAAGSASAVRPGHGLGLSLAREIVRAFHGELRLVSCAEGRIRFRMALPLAEPCESTPADAD